MHNSDLLLLMLNAEQHLLGDPDGACECHKQNISAAVCAEPRTLSLSNVPVGAAAMIENKTV